jgi:DNA-binding LacI/PurR family transcriptional regulator
MARVTLQTIADRVGVSRMTVSNAFSRPDQLSHDLRDRILAAAADLGYAGPDPAARALARGSTGAVGVLLTDVLSEAFGDEVATRFLSAVVEGLAPTGLALTLLTSTESDDVVPARDVAIDGALLYSCRPESSAREWLLRRKLPLVFVDQDPRPGIPSVNVDDRSGAEAAARHLVELGHRRVAILTVLLDHPTGVVAAVDPRDGRWGHPQEQRMEGWLAGLAAAGVQPATVVHVPHNDDDRADEGAALVLAAEPRVTAVLCFSDVLAFGVLRAARARGLAVPGELSVVGFDDNPLAPRSDPPLTTVRQDVAEKGHLAATALVTAIADGRSGRRPARARHHNLPTELVLRATTAPAP